MRGRCSNMVNADLFEAFYRGEDELTRKTKGMKTVEKTAHGPDQAADTGT